MAKLGHVGARDFGRNAKPFHEFLDNALFGSSLLQKLKNQGAGAVEGKHFAAVNVQNHAAIGCVYATGTLGYWGHEASGSSYLRHFRESNLPDGTVRFHFVERMFAKTNDRCGKGHRAAARALVPIQQLGELSGFVKSLGLHPPQDRHHPAEHFHVNTISQPENLARNPGAGTHDQRATLQAASGTQAPSAS